MTKSVQCSDLPIDKEHKSSNSLSVFNPIRTLQFLLKEIMEFPGVKSAKTIILNFKNICNLINYIYYLNVC